MHKTLLNLAKNGELELKFYDKEDIAYVQMIEEHLKDRIVRFGILEDKEKYAYKFCAYYYPHILEELEGTIKTSD